MLSQRCNRVTSAVVTLSMLMSLVPAPALAQVVPTGQQDGGEVEQAFEPEASSSQEADEQQPLEGTTALGETTESDDLAAAVVEDAGISAEDGVDGVNGSVAEGAGDSETVAEDNTDGADSSDASDSVAASDDAAQDQSTADSNAAGADADATSSSDSETQIRELVPGENVAITLESDSDFLFSFTPTRDSKYRVISDYDVTVGCYTDAACTSPASGCGNDYYCPIYELSAGTTYYLKYSIDAGSGATRVAGIDDYYDIASTCFTVYETEMADAPTGWKERHLSRQLQGNEAESLDPNIYQNQDYTETWYDPTGTAVSTTTVGGTYQLVYQGIGKYHGTRTVQVEIPDPKTLGTSLTQAYVSTACVLDDVSDISFTVKQFNPITQRNAALNERFQYVVKSWADEEGTILEGKPTCAGSFVATLEGIGDYTGTVTVSVTVVDAHDLSSGWEPYEWPSNGSWYVLNGIAYYSNEESPTFTLCRTIAGKTIVLHEGQDFAFVGWEDAYGSDVIGNPTQAGTYYPVFKGINEYVGSFDSGFVDFGSYDTDITGKVNYHWRVSWSLKKVDDASETLCPTVSVEATRINNLSLTEGRDYTVTWTDESGATLDKAPTEPGSYTAIVTGCGDFSGTVRLSVDFDGGHDISQASYFLGGSYSSGVFGIMPDGSFVTPSVSWIELDDYCDYDGANWETSGWETAEGESLSGEPSTVGDYYLVVNGKGSWYGTLKIPVHLADFSDISKAQASISSWNEWYRHGNIDFDGVFTAPNIRLEQEGYGYLDSSYWQIVGWETSDGESLPGNPTAGGSYIAVIEGCNGSHGTLRVSVEVVDHTDISSSCWSVKSNVGQVYLDNGNLGVTFSLVHNDYPAYTVAQDDSFTLSWLDAEGNPVDKPSHGGTYTAVFEGTGTYHGTRTLEVEVQETNSFDSFLTGAWKWVSYVLDGLFQSPSINVYQTVYDSVYEGGHSASYERVNLTKGVDYAIAGWVDANGDTIEGEPSKPGDYSAVIQGIGKYDGTMLAPGTVRDGHDLSLNIWNAYPGGTFYILGDSFHPGKFTLYSYFGSKQVSLTQDKDFTVSWRDSNGREIAGEPSSAGSYIAVLHGIGAYSAETTCQVEVRDYSDLSSNIWNYSLGYDPYYFLNGELYAPTISLYANLSGTQTELIEGVDFDITWRDSLGTNLAGAPVEPGTYTVSCVGKGAYHGERDIEVVLSDISDISSDVWQISQASGSRAYIVGDTFIAPELTVRFQYSVGDWSTSSFSLGNDDYAIAAWLDEDGNDIGGEPDEAGVYFAEVTGKGQYHGDRLVRVNVADLSDISSSAWHTRVVGSAYILGGALKLPQFNVFAQPGGTYSNEIALVEGKDYVLSGWQDSQGNELVDGEPTSAGMYRAVFTAIGAYSGTRTVLVSVRDASDISSSLWTTSTTGKAYLSKGAFHAPMFQVKLTDAGTTLSVGKGLSLSWLDAEGAPIKGLPSAAGSYTAVLKGTGEYTGARYVSIKVTTTSDLAITAQPSDKKAYVGQNAVFSVKATGGAGSVSYQWQWRKDSSASWANCTSASGAGFASPTLATAMNKAKDGRQYRCIVTDSLGDKVISNVATLSLSKTSTLRISAQPQDASAASGYSVTFAVKVTGGTAPITYQWQWRKDSSASWANCTSASGQGWDSDSLVVKMNAARDGRQFRCIVSDAAGARLYTQAATLSLATASVSLSSQPKDVSTAAGQTATFAVAASSTVRAGVSYQWQWRSSASAAWSNCTAASGEGWNASQLSVTAYAARDGRQFRCCVTGAAGTAVYSNAATLHVVK